MTARNGTVVTTLASGMKTTITNGADPRFGIAAPIPTSLTSVSPAGLTFQQTMSEIAALSTPTNPLSLTTLSTTITTDPTNSLSYTNKYTAATRTWAMTTAAGRSRTLALDTLGRLSTSQRDSLDADAFAYDTFGRLASLTQGSRVRTSHTTRTGCSRR